MLIVDTGPLVALADLKDPDHEACLELLTVEPGPLLTTGLVIAEAAYLIHREVGVDGEFALYADITAGLFRIEELTTADWQRVHALVDRYRDLPLGGTDASVIALAERHGGPDQILVDNVRRLSSKIVLPSAGGDEAAGLVAGEEAPDPGRGPGSRLPGHPQEQEVAGLKPGPRWCRHRLVWTCRHVNRRRGCQRSGAATATASAPALFDRDAG